MDTSLPVIAHLFFMKIRLEHPVTIISYKFLIVMKCMFIMFVISPLFLSLVVSCVRDEKVA